MTFNYGEVLGKAWQIIWKYKILWLFGLLASCGRGNSGPSNNFGWRESSRDLPPAFQRPFYNFERFFENIQAWQIALIVLGFILLILLIIFITNYISTIGRLGLVKGVQKGDREDTLSLTFAELLQTGGPLFWRVFWLNLLAGIILGFAILLLLLPFFGMGVLTLGIGFLCLFPLICLLVPVGWLIYVILEQANISLIIEESTIMDALRKAWELFQKNLAVYILMAIILGVIGLVVGSVLALPAIAASIPLIGGIAWGTGRALSTGAIIALVCCVVYFPVLLVANGILTAYTSSAWTLTYLRLTRLAPPPQVVPPPLDYQTF